MNSLGVGTSKREVYYFNQSDHVQSDQVDQVDQVDPVESVGSRWKYNLPRNTFILEPPKGGSAEKNVGGSPALGDSTTISLSV